MKSKFAPRSVLKIFTVISLFAATSSSAEGIKRVWYKDILAEGAVSKAAASPALGAVDGWNVSASDSSIFQLTTGCPNPPADRAPVSSVFMQLGSRDFSTNIKHVPGLNFQTTKSILSLDEVKSLISGKARIQVRVAGERNRCMQDTVNSYFTFRAICKSDLVFDEVFDFQRWKTFVDFKSSGKLEHSETRFDQTAYLDLDPATCDMSPVLLVGVTNDQASIDFRTIEVTVYNVPK